MNKQRKVLITTTYNEMGMIIDTKSEEVADVVPAKRGQWIYQSSTYNRDGWESNIYECSCCHGKIQIRYYIDRNDHVSKHEKFCKHCGADMRIKEGENPTGAAYGTQTDKA